MYFQLLKGEVAHMGARLVLPQPAYRLEGVKIDYDLMPKQAVELLSGSNPDIGLWPEDKMELWNGGKTGVVETTLPILWDRQSFTTAQGRQKQEASGIGFALPVEIASLALPENEPEQIRKALHELGMWWLVALRQSDEELWQHDSVFRPFCLVLFPDCFEFGLGFAGVDWDDLSALAGAPQVSQ